MSVFAAGAPQIWAMADRHSQDRNFVPGITRRLFRFVSSRSPARNGMARRCHVSRYNVREEPIGAGTTSRDASDSCRILILCTAFGCGGAAPGRSRLGGDRSRTARRWSKPAIARAATPPIRAKPFAGGKRIDTPFGGIYSPNLTPDRDTGLGAWSDDDFLPRAALGRGARRLALLSGLPLSEFHQADPRRHSGDPRLSRDADAGQQLSRRRRSCAGR